jgi:hypothetical protein
MANEARKTATHASTIVVERLTLLIRILEAPGSNLGQETGLPNMFS